MRLAAILLTGLCLGATAATLAPVSSAAAMGATPRGTLAPLPAVTRVEYFCSPGFDVSGGRCVATTSRDEVDLYLNETYGDAAPRRHYRRHRQRHGLRERY